MPRRIPRDDPALAGMSQATILQAAKQAAKAELFHIRSLKEELRRAQRLEAIAKNVAYGPNVSRSFVENAEDLRMELEFWIKGIETNHRAVTKHFSPGWEKTV